MPHPRRESGQATVEVVALMPVLVLVGLLCWQAVVAGQAAWLSGAAARSAARAAAVGGDARAAARGVLPGPLRAGVRVRTGDDGAVRVVVAVPTVVGDARIGQVTAQARLTAPGP